MLELPSSPQSSSINTSESIPVQSPPNEPTTKKSVSPIVILLVGMLLGGGVLAATLFAFPELAEVVAPKDLYSSRTSLVEQSTSQVTETPEIPPTVESDPEELTWKRADFGSFSYEYPEGWHVAELWKRSGDEYPIYIIMDDIPVNDAPGDVPPGKFQIVLTNGLQDPDARFEDLRQPFSPDEYSEITTENLTGEVGTIYYNSGRISTEYRSGEFFQQYVFTFNEDPSDRINQYVAVANMSGDNPQHAEILRHVVLSFKEGL